MSIPLSTRGKRLGAAAASGLLLLVVAAGTIHGVRAAVAQALYYQSKYGSARTETTAVLGRADRAARLYPFNYRFCVYAAERAFATCHDGPEALSAPHTAAARRWCDAGLALNFHSTTLRLLKVRLLEEESAARAAEFLEAYVDWDFWDPYYHAELVRLHAAAGDFAKAFRSLPWVEGSEYYVRSKKVLQAAWQREMAMPEME